MNDSLTVTTLPTNAEYAMPRPAKEENIAQLIDRIEELRGFYDLPRVAFAEKLRYSPSNYANMIARGSKPSPELLMGLAAHTGVNLSWLLTGEGPMLKGQPAQPQEGTAPPAESQTAQPGSDVPALIAGLVREFGRLSAELGHAQGLAAGMGSHGRDAAAHALLDEGLRRADANRQEEEPAQTAGSQG